MRSVLSETVMPFFRRPPVLQLAALCHRQTARGREILLITSSHGRWILPKGWPIDGKTSGETAMKEAWEEAGIKEGDVANDPVGSFMTHKRYDDGRAIPCETAVYAIEVKKVANKFPEAEKRERKWVSVEEATDLVDDTGLQRLLQKF
ncbi:NUDIX hydrolase [Cognatiyoonia koreensis]|nr:NUDIX hydrolase [Cognatiyoonia koreensis]